MSVGLFRYNGDIYDDDSEVTLSVNISTEAFYLKYWERARKELGIKYIQEGAEFNKSKLKDILKELDLLRNWAIKNLSGKELEYMKGRIENLQDVIPNAFIDEETILYII